MAPAGRAMRTGKYDGFVSRNTVDADIEKGPYHQTKEKYKKKHM